MPRTPRSRLACLVKLFAYAAALHIGSALAAAADCTAALQQTADEVSALPGATPSEVTDRLQTDYDEASALADSDPAACMAVVRRMNEVVRRYRTPGSAGGRGTAGPTAPAPNRASDRPNPGPAPRVERAARDEAAGSRRERLERAAVQDVEDARAVAAYGEAFKAYRLAVHAVAENMDPQPAAVAAVDKAVEDVVVIIDQMEDDVLVNDDVDALHAKLEDAFRRLDARCRALEREKQRWRLATARKKAQQAKDDRLEREGNFLAPLAPTAIERRFEEAKQRYLRAEAELSRAEFAAKQVRNKIDPLLHWYQPFRDMKPGYKQAYKAAYARHQDEQEALDAKCNGSSLGACAQLIRTTNDRQRRELDTIFATYVIRE
ncbi:hypothetical protein FHS95_000178 [Sphingomonas naasensis]|uniref:DUF1311 domain-containing protein n=1 Tax=Sphingomonas naasensis TaxID=1344951 RepID=A0A4V3QXB3_9SPHN|nr:hypothetical protein [Sphingomonas naasensis]NIJ18509.1 hypothetical protein [Sphingomonas naasensis]TGX45762.1 hypothetical protein E5A74_00855 [Sphingomonas naasensis]